MVSTVKILSIVLGLTALAAPSLAQSPPPASFVTPKQFYGIQGFRNRPVDDVATGDLNGDGIPDIVPWAALDGGSFVIGVLLGNGDGTFQPGIYYPLDNVAPVAVALGDFNRDGHVDVAVLLNGAPGSVAIYFGNGTGALGKPSLHQVGNQGATFFNNLVAADLNGDHKLDLVATNNADSTVSVLLGKGDGTFEPAVAYSTGTASMNQTGANWVAIADLNNDGKPDLVVACDGNNQTLSVLLGNGDGTFQGPAMRFLPGASSVAIANLTGDKKKLDLVVADYNDSTTWVLPGNGDGTFQPGQAYATTPQDQGLAVADLNRDGKLDFVVGDNQSELVTVALGNGDGTFRASANYGLTYASQILAIAAADFNGDGNLDIVEAGGSPANNAVSVMLGSAHGVLGAPVSAKPLCNTPNWVDAGDVNGDGLPDIVASPNCENTGVAVLLGKGDGTFESPVYYPTGNSNAYPGVVKLADTRGKGELDVLVSNVDGSLSVMLAKGKGIFETGRVIPGVTGLAEPILTGDFNNDGKLDLALPDFANSAVTILLGTGKGTFEAPISLTTAQGVPERPQGLAVGDFNHDGNLDLAVNSNSLGVSGSYGGGFAVLLGNGNGTFTFSADYGWGTGTTTSPGSMATADVNGDGIVDLLIPLGQGGGGMIVYLGNGDGTFTRDNTGTSSSVGFLAGTNSQMVVTGDFNDDGAIDAAVVENAGWFNSYVTLLINNTPPVSASPLVVAFGSHSVGSTSNTHTVLLTNNQPTSLAVDGIGISGPDPGDFAYKSACAATLLPGADCDISVTFEPSATGLRTAVLTITDGAGTQTVSLSGTGK